MNNILRWILSILFVIALGVFAYMYFGTTVFTPRQSTKDTVTFKLNDLELEVFYNRPSKRNRAIFGALVPYHQVWRTGANEATTFKTNLPLQVNGTTLNAGKYTLWSIPSDSTWQVIFNAKQYPWGVDDTMKPMREAAFDAATVTVPVQSITPPVEQFTIGFDNSTGNLFLTLAWDTVKIMIPIAAK